jgi:CheY-like chemotaxis protein
MVGGLNILIVDDNETNLEVARMMLTGKNKVTTAKSGLEAMKIMAESDFDIIFMDVQMPGIDGLTTTTWIRSMERGGRPEVTLPKTFVRRLAHRLNGRHIPIIAMTAHALEDDKERCLAAGMDDHISKPFLYHHIVAVLQTLKPNTVLTALSSRSEEAIPLENSPDLVTSYIKRTTKLSDEQVQQIKVNAMNYLTDYLADAKKALEDNDFPALSHQSHKIKGILLQCGLSVLAEKAQEMDVRARSYDVFPFRETLTEIQNAIDEFSLKQ